MVNLLKNKRIILGVTGSIACYKAAELASKLTQAEALVDVILTQAATQFITPPPSVRHGRRRVEVTCGGRVHVLHQPGAAPVCGGRPASANTIAKLAHGIADNLLTVTSLAPLALSPRRWMAACTPILHPG
jgi:phosphopantothenoylcysteine decarboxylase/phosphopantothenate--cysteine ligase